MEDCVILRRYYSMGKFVTPLRAEKLSERNWKLLEALIYRSDTLDDYILVPKGFVTNFASVPRLPFMYLLFGGVGDEAATLHDWLYSKEYSLDISRALADKVLRGVIVECLVKDGRARWKAVLIAYAMWAGVRLGGASHWKQ